MFYHFLILKKEQLVTANGVFVLTLIWVLWYTMVSTQL